MKTIDKTSWLASLEQQVEGQIQEAVQHFQNLDENTLHNPSPTGGWSIAQCLAHLITYGHYYLPRLKQGLQKQQPGRHPADTFVSSWLGAYLTKLMDSKANSRKLKAAKRHLPADTLFPHQVVAEFIDQQEELLRLLRIARKADLNTVRVPLSIAAWVRLPLGDILEFMVVHTERHIAQAKRNTTQLV
ncbi:DinB family protein [Spirosoma arcticum]